MPDDPTHTPSGAAGTALLLSLLSVNGLIIAQGDLLTKDSGLTAVRWQILNAASQELQTVSQLARRMNLTRQSLQGTVSVMIRTGFLTLVDNPNHLKAKLVAVTDKGRAALVTLKTLQVRWIDAVCADFSPAELQRTKAVIERFHAALDATPVPRAKVTKSRTRARSA